MSAWADVDRVVKSPAAAGGTDIVNALKLYGEWSAWKSVKELSWKVHLMHFMHLAGRQTLICSF